VPAAQVQHVGQARSACDKRSGQGISLKVTDALVAPVVIVAHNRVHYLAKCLMTLLRSVKVFLGQAEGAPSRR
jgi:hypothetical protein